MSRKRDLTEVRQWTGALFQQLRLDAKLSQMQLCEIADVHQGYISNLENGRALPHLDTVLYLLDCMGYEGITFLTGGDEGDYGYYVIGEPKPRKGKRERVLG